MSWPGPERNVDSLYPVEVSWQLSKTAGVHVRPPPGCPGGPGGTTRKFCFRISHLQKPTNPVSDIKSASITRFTC